MRFTLSLRIGMCHIVDCIIMTFLMYSSPPGGSPIFIVHRFSSLQFPVRCTMNIWWVCGIGFRDLVLPWLGQYVCDIYDPGFRGSSSVTACGSAWAPIMLALLLHHCLRAPLFYLCSWLGERLSRQIDTVHSGGVCVAGLSFFKTRANQFLR